MSINKSFAHDPTSTTTWVFHNQKNNYSQVESWVNNTCEPKNTSRIQGFVTTQDRRSGNYGVNTYCAQDLSNKQYSFKSINWQNKPDNITQLLNTSDANILGFYHSANTNGLDDIVFTIVGGAAPGHKQWRHKVFKKDWQQVEAHLNSPLCSASDISGIRGFTSQFGGIDYNIHVWCREDGIPATSYSVVNGSYSEYMNVLQSGHSVVLLGHYQDINSDYSVFYAMDVSN